MKRANLRIVSSDGDSAIERLLDFLLMPVLEKNVADFPGLPVCEIHSPVVDIVPLPCDRRAETPRTVAGALRGAHVIGRRIRSATW
jgi:hypothetical protein